MTVPPIVSPQDLKLFREDPQREKSLGIVDYVVCRKCGAKLCMIFKQHLLKDGYSSGTDYQQEFEGAPIYSIWVDANKHNWYFDHKAQVITDATQWNKKHPKRHKKAQKKYRRTPRGKQKAKARRDKRNQLIQELLRNGRLVQLQKQKQPRGTAPSQRKAGRRKGAEEDRQYFKVGKAVEQKIASGVELTAARRLVADAEGVSYSSVVRYHKQFRSRVTRDGNMSPISITG